MPSIRGDIGGINQVRAMYSEYAFIDDNGTVRAKPAQAKPKAEATTKWDHIVERSYEEPVKWYLIVFKPYDKPYGRDPAFFIHRGLDKCRKLLKRPHAYVMTREIKAAKVHVNAIAATSQDILRHHDQSYCSKYKIHVQLLHNLGDRRRALAYITKESNERTFEKYRDYLVHSK